MKVLGISFGRKNQRSDVMVKEALFAAKAAGADVQFINTVRMDIGHCRACDYCSRMRDNGETEIHCCMKDDYHILEEACLEADGIIIAAPVYAVGIVGQFKNFVDRFGPSHDRAALIEENKDVYKRQRIYIKRNMEVYASGMCNFLCRNTCWNLSLLLDRKKTIKG